MEVFSKTCVAVLAAGASRRFGAPFNIENI